MLRSVRRLGKKGNPCSRRSNDRGKNRWGWTSLFPESEAATLEVARQPRANGDKLHYAAPELTVKENSLEKFIFMFFS
jgi:hypothetical protein